MIDHYRILDVTRDATESEIKKAYRKMAAGYHPDRVESLGPRIKDFAMDEMRKLNEAKETLLDPEKRRRYDQSLTEEGKPRTSTSQSFKCPHCSRAITATVGNQPYVTYCPYCQRGMTIPASTSDRSNGNGQKNMDRLSIYREAVRRAMIDGQITNDEMMILEGLRQSLSISPMEHQEIILSSKAVK